MVPISVSSIDGAVKTGAEKARYDSERFSRGLGSFGKAFGDGILTARLAKEDADEQEAQKLRDAIKGRDTAALENLTRGGMWGRLFGKKEPEPQAGQDSTVYSSFAGWGLTPGLKARQQEALNRRSLIAKAQGRLEEIENAPTARRAAERAGMATGYVPASEQDKMDAAVELEQQKYERELKNRHADIANRSYDNNNKQAEYTQNRINQIRYNAQGRDLTDDEVAEIRELKASAAQYRNASAMDRKWLENNVPEGDPRLNFGERPETVAPGEASNGFNDLYLQNYKGLDKPFLNTARTITDTMLQDVAAQLGITDAGQKAILRKYLESDLRESIAQEQYRQEQERYNLGITGTKQGITQNELAIKQSDFNIKNSQFNSEFPNYSGLVSQDTQNRTAAARAGDLFRNGDYKGAIETLKGSMPESDKFGLKFPLISWTSANNATRDDAIKALKAFNESMKIVADEIGKANSRKKELGL